MSKKLIYDLVTCDCFLDNYTQSNVIDEIS